MAENPLVNIRKMTSLNFVTSGCKSVDLIWSNSIASSGRLDYAIPKAFNNKFAGGITGPRLRRIRRKAQQVSIMQAIRRSVLHLLHRHRTTALAEATFS